MRKYTNYYSSIKIERESMKLAVIVMCVVADTAGDDGGDSWA